MNHKTSWITQGKKEYVVVDYLFYLYTSFHISQNKNIEITE